MPRLRTVVIAESLEELQQLIEHHAGTPQGTRLQFLKYLKDTPHRTISEAAKLSGMARRYAVRVWEVYRIGGLAQVLRLGEIPSGKGAGAKAVLPPKEEPADIPTPRIDIPREAEEVGGMRAGALIGFMNAIAGLREIKETEKWARRFRDILMEFIPEVDYAVVHVNTRMTPRGRSVSWRFNQHHLPDGQVVTTMKRPNKIIGPFYHSLIEDGKNQGFPFNRYHYPPLGYDFHLPPTMNKNLTIDIGSILLFRNIVSDPFTSNVSEFVDSIRPFIEFVYHEFDMRLRNANPSGDLFFGAVNRVAGDVGLSDREEEVLFLQLCGNMIEEIGELLHISTSTVRSHIQSIYRKAGVQRLSELFARYFTPRDYFPQKKRGSEE